LIPCRLKGVFPSRTSSAFDDVLALFTARNRTKIFRTAVLAQGGAITTNHETKKPSVLLGSDGLGSVQTSDLVPPQGLEQASKTLGNSNNSQTVPPPVPPSSIDSIPSDAIELLSIWSKLDEPARRDLLKVARALACGTLER
jgi:hypothetical protein